MSAVNYEKLMENFVQESLGLLEDLESSVLELEQNFQSSVVDKVFRAIHTIKGNSGLFDLKRIKDLSHAMESILNLMRNHSVSNSSEIIDVFLETIDRLKAMVSDIKNSNTFQVDDLIAKFNSLRPAPIPALVENKVVEIKSKEVTPIIQKVESKVELNGTSSTITANPEIAPIKPNNEVKLKLDIPKSFFYKAKEENKYLTLYTYDVYKQNFKNLSDIESFYRRLIKENALVTKGVVQGKTSDLVGSDEYQLIFFMVLIQSDNTHSILEKENIQIYSSRILYNPNEAKTVSNVSPQVVQNNSVATSESQKEPASKEPPIDVLHKQEPIQSATIQESKVQGLVMDAKPLLSKIEHEDHPSDKIDLNPIKIETDASQKETYLKVPISLIDGLINLAGETVIARNELLQKIDMLEESSLAVSGKKISYLVSKIQEGIMKTRLQELNTVFQRLPRLVRDVCLATGKKVELIISGGNIELDKTLIDAILDPLMHMIRNCIDHGIESVEERQKAGKSLIGIIRLTANLRGGNVIISIKDDGKGLNAEKIKAKAINSGVITKEQLEGFTPQEIYDLIFLPGFSTADAVTTTSGRGVGMDVVRSNMKKVGGSAEISSEMNKGTLLTLTIPQTLSIVTCLLIKSCEKRFALPQSNIKELILINPELYSEVEGHRMYKLRGHLLPLIDLASFLGLKDADKSKPTYIAVVRSEKHHFGLLIENIINPEEIVVKSLGSLFAGLNLFSGAAIMGDGEAVLILDVPGIAKFANLQTNVVDKEKAREELDEINSKTNSLVNRSGYLLFDLGSQSFAVMVSSVPRIEKISTKDINFFLKYETINYRNSTVPLVRLDKLYTFDVDNLGEDFYVIIFKFNKRRIGVVASDVKNVITDLIELDKDTFRGDSIIGHTIINGEVIIFLDIEDLIERLYKEHFKDINKHFHAEDGESKDEVTLEISDNIIDKGYSKLNQTVVGV